MRPGSPAGLYNLALLLWIRNARLVIADQEVLSVRTIRWPDGILNRGPAAEQATEPQDRGPPRMREDRDEEVLGAAVAHLQGVPVGAEHDGDEDKGDVKQVQVALAVPDGHLEAAP